MTSEQALRLTATKLKTAPGLITNPYLEAEILMAKALKTSRESVLANSERQLTAGQQRQLNNLVRRRLTGEPIAYLLAEKEFYGLNFKVNKNVLVPRPETELIVDKALDLIGALAQKGKKIIMVDIGTGSGCIIISLAKQLSGLLPSDYFKNNLFFWATDISAPALKIARFNAQKHKLAGQIKFFSGHLIQPLINKISKTAADYLIFLANLPYLTPKQIKSSVSIQSEPRLALDGGPDGLKYYRQLFKQIKAKKLTADFNLFLLAEIDPQQKTAFRKLKQKYWPTSLIEFSPDLAGQARLVKISNCQPKAD